MTLNIAELNGQLDSEPSPPGISKNVHAYLFQQPPILSTSLSLPATHPTHKESAISPLLKKNTLDKEELCNYRPNSNLSLISKIIERVVKSRLMDHLTSKSLLNSQQSAYCKHHSTVTALVHPRSPRQCNRITERITSLPTRPLYCFRYD